MEQKGMIFDIQRFSIHDGPGIRTTVFLKGCPLRCLWCHNPESQSPLPETGIVNGFGETGAAPRTRVIGREVTTREVMEEVKKDIQYYKNSGGGMTVSGGEPLNQPDFTLSLLELAKDAGIHTCVETCGYAGKDSIQRIIPFTDLFLYDYKETNTARHLEFTGVGNERILSNLRLILENGTSVILRCPIIPGMNDTEEHFLGIVHMEKTNPELLGIEVMAYHDMGKSKAAQIGKRYELEGIPTVSEELREEWIDRLKGYGCTKVY